MVSYKVSIIIPVYKVEPYIVRCIESVLRQTYRNLEVILVDDCTPDRSMELAKECIEQSPLSKDLSFIYLKHDHNRGLSAARNTGMDVAIGEYVYFLDSDDEITEDCMETLKSPLEEKRYDFVIGDCEIKDINEWNPQLRIPEGELNGKELILSAYAKREWYPMAWNKLCRLAYLKEKDITFLEDIIHEDELFSFFLACTAETMYVVATPTYIYHVRQGSIMLSGDIQRSNNSIKKILYEMLRFQKQHSLYSYTMEMLNLQFITIVEKRLRRENDFTLFRFYRFIRQTDMRPRRALLSIYSDIASRIKHADLFLPWPFGFCVRWLIWSVARIRTGGAYVPFIY